MKKFGGFWLTPRILLILFLVMLVSCVIFAGACIGYGYAHLNVIGYSDDLNNSEIADAVRQGKDTSALGLTDVELSNAAKAYKTANAPLGLKDTADTTAEELETRLKGYAEFNSARDSSSLRNMLFVCTDSDRTEMILCLLVSADSITHNCTVVSLPSYLLVLDDELGMTKLGNVYFSRGIEGLAQTCGKMLGLSVTDTGKMNIGSAAELITAADANFGYDIIISNSGLDVKHENKKITFSALDNMLRLLVRDVRTNMDINSLYRFAKVLVGSLGNGLRLISPAALETSAVTTFDGRSALVVDFVAVRSLIG